MTHGLLFRFTGKTGEGRVTAMNKGYSKTKRMTVIAMLITAAFVLSWLEMLVSLPMVIPGVKIGLANAAILFALYHCGKRDALIVLIGRLVLSSILFGNAAAMIMSISGGILSFIAMSAAKLLLDRHVIIVSMTGGVFHNIGQLVSASIILSTSFAYLAPYLILGGIAAGWFNGFIVSRLLKIKPLSRKKPQ